MSKIRLFVDSSHNWIGNKLFVVIIGTKNDEGHFFT